MTRTHVVYFTKDELRTLDRGLADLWASLNERRPYISKEAAQAMERRIQLIHTAGLLLLEPVPGPFE